MAGGVLLALSICMLIQPAEEQLANGETQTAVARLPVALVGALWLKVENPAFIVWAWSISSLINAAAMLWLFKRGKWKTIKV